MCSVSCNLTFICEDSVEDVGEVNLPLSNPGTQILPVQQVQEQTKLTHQLLHRCSKSIHSIYTLRDAVIILDICYVF